MQRHKELEKNTVQLSLEKAWLERWTEFVSLFSSQSDWATFGKVLGTIGSGSPISNEDKLIACAVLSNFRRAQQLLNELSELHTWLSPALTSKERVSLVDQHAPELSAEGMAFQGLRELADLVKKNPIGAAPKRRSVAVRVVDLRRSKPKLSWMQATIECCNCGKPKHTQGCMQVVRQEVMALEKVLHKYGIHPTDNVKV